MRILLTVVVAALAGALPAAGGPPAVGTAQYVVQPDPRLCPSPRCGGYWVVLANRTQTRCSNDILRPRCYVARVVGEERHPLALGVSAGALVRAAIEPWTFDGMGELGMLVVADLRVPAGQKLLRESIFRVSDLGIRCVRAPCFSLRAGRINTLFKTKLSGVVLRPALLSAEEQARAEAALTTTNGLFAAGRIFASTDGGRVLRISRVYLKAALPRA